MVRRGLELGMPGGAMGAGAALLGERLLGSVMPAVRPGDPWAITIAIVAVLAIASLASYVPARRATRIEPIAALRVD